MGRKLKISVAISFFMLIQFSGCGGRSSKGDEKSEAQRKFELGVLHLEEGEGLKAFLIFDELMNEDPKNPHYIYGKALAIVERELASAAEKTKQILDFINEVGRALASPPQNEFHWNKTKTKTQDKRKVERKIIDSVLLKILKIAFLDTTDKFSALLRGTDFFSLAGDNFIFPIRRFRIKFYFGGEEINSFSFYGKHGIEEAYIIAGLAELIRFVLYSILSVSFDLEIPEIFSILNYAGKQGGILTLLSDPIEVGFPSLYWVLERNRKILTAPYKDEMRKAELALDKQIEYFENYHLKIYEKFSKGDTREGFLIFSKGDKSAYLRAQIGEGEIKEFRTSSSIEGIRIAGEGMKLVRKSIEEGYLVPCSHIEGPVTSLLSAVSNSGFSSVLAESASAGAGEEGKEIEERFNKAVQLILYFTSWFSAFVALCSQDLFYFDFSKYFDALSSLRNIIPAYFSATTKDVISPLRNMIIEWECGREDGINTLTYSSEFFDPSSVGLMCRRKVKFYDMEHFQDFLTMVRFPGELSPEISVIPKDGIRSPTGYLLIPDPSVAGFLWIDPKVLWPDCEIPCRGECKIQKLEGEVGQCIANAGFAEIGRRIYVGRGF